MVITLISPQMWPVYISAGMIAALAVLSAAALSSLFIYIVRRVFNASENRRN